MLAARIGIDVETLINDAVQSDSALRVSGARQRNERGQREMMLFHSVISRWFSLLNSYSEITTSKRLISDPGRVCSASAWGCPLFTHLALVFLRPQTFDRKVD